MPDPFDDDHQRPPDEDHSNPYASFAAEQYSGANLSGGRAPLNPWFSIWLQPRATIRQIVERDPRRHVVLLAALAGIDQGLNSASANNLGNNLSLPQILLFAFIVGSVGGIISLYIFGTLVRWAGSWLGGVATDEQVRAAIAWGSIPVIWALLLWIPEIGLFGHEIFTEEMPSTHANAGLAIALIVFAVANIAIIIWQLVVIMMCIGEVHRFSAWKALGAFLLAELVIIIPIALIVVAVMSVAG